MSEITLRNGFQYTLLTRGEDIRRMPGITIRDVLNNVPNTCSFQVDGDSNVPLVGEKIEIIDTFDSDRLLFAGIVMTVEQVYEDQITQLAWNVTCVDFTWLLNRRRPVGTYTAVSATDIVKDLIAKYAPTFTTEFVQTDLARLSMFFDGSQDFTTCLNRIAETLGGGHWYVDYDQVVHFFHTVPPTIQLPDFPESIVTLGPIGSGGSGAGGGALTCVEGPYQQNVIWAGEPNDYLFFQVTYVYDNGAESALGPSAAPFPADQAHIWNFSNIPIGFPAGDLQVVMRRIYVTWASHHDTRLNNRFLFTEIRDNTTTTLQTASFSQGRVLPNPPPPAPIKPYVAPPAGPVLPATARESATTSGWAYFPGTFNELSYGPGNYAFRIANIYADMTESLPGAESDPVALVGNHKVTLSNVPIGADLNGVPVIARRVYAVYKSGPFGEGIGRIDTGIGYGWDLIPNNSSTQYDVQPVLPGFPAQAASASLPNGEIVPGVNWPNADGPNLEDTLPSPADIDEDNEDLLKDPAFVSTTDLSQVRNRIYIRGVGTRVVEGVAAGATQIAVAEMRFFSTGGGKVYIDGEILPYMGVSAPSGSGTLILAQGVGRDLPEGATISLHLQVDSVASQEAMGRAELDKDGNPTDGIHEFTIVDTSLQTPFECFMRGMAELELFAFPVVTIKYATRDPNTRSGRVVHVDMTNPPIVGDFLIQDVTIDQIHDESDQLNPRYIATASSIKFDLNDLLLKILDQNPSAASGGASAAGTGDTQGTADTFQSNPLLRRVAWAHHWPSVAGIVAYQSAGMVVPASSGTTPVYDTDELPKYGSTNATPDRRWAGLISATTLNDVSGFMGADWFFLEDNFDLMFHVRTGKVLTEVCLWAGLTSSPTIPLSPGGTNVAICAIRYSTGSGAGDGAWRGILQPQGVGHSQYRTDPLMTITAKHEYILRIRSQGGPQYDKIKVSFKVDDITSNSLGSWKPVTYAQTLSAGETPDHNMPVANPIGPPPGMVVFAGAQTLTGGATTSKRKMYWRRLAITAD